MAKYIDKEMLSKDLEKRWNVNNDHDFADKEVWDALEKAPAADVVEQKHGKWIDMGDFEMCSVCKGTHLKRFQSYYGDVTWIKTDFCPNCGARMDLESSTGRKGVKT